MSGEGLCAGDFAALVLPASSALVPLERVCGGPSFAAPVALRAPSGVVGPGRYCWSRAVCLSLREVSAPFFFARQCSFVIGRCGQDFFKDGLGGDEHKVVPKGGLQNRINGMLELDEVLGSGLGLGLSPSFSAIRCKPVSLLAYKHDSTVTFFVMPTLI